MRHAPPLRACFFLLLMQLICCSALYDETDDVQTFNSESDFKRKVLQSDSIWFVQFYAPWCGHCKNLAPTYKQAATILKGIVNLGAVDVASDGPGQRISAPYGVQGFPTIKLFMDDKQSPETYEGPRELQAIIKAAADAVSKTVTLRANPGGRSESTMPSKVVQLSAANWNEKLLGNKLVGMVAFVAPWCGHCKALLPEWEKASVDLDGSGAFLGVVDATVETTLASQYRVEGYPTIKVFPGGDKSGEAEDYMGGRTQQDIVRYALEEVERSGVPKDVAELTNSTVLTENCAGTNKICVLCGLPHILDSMAAGRNKYKETIKAVSKTFRGMSFEFLWFEGSSQPKLEAALELTFGFPAVAALSMDKTAYAVLHGSFTEKNIGKFLSSITTGRQSTIRLSDLPEIVDVEPWDGEDGTPFEDEPLDDIMGWDDGEEL